MNNFGYTYRKYNVNQNFFKTWTNEMAYILGYIFSDGNIDRPSKSKRLRMSSKDIDILQDIKTVLNSEHPIKVESNKNGSWYALNIYSEEIVNDLIKLGIHENKSFTIKMPNIPIEFTPDFVRGVFDGDGCIYGAVPKNRHSIKLELSLASGSESFIKDLLKICKEQTAYDKYNLRYRTKGNIWEIRTCTTGAKLFYKFIYNNPNSLKLKRKYDKYTDFMNKTHKPLR